MPVIPFIPAIIGAGAGIGGAAIASHGATSAANTQAASADKALAVATQQHDQERADNSPYRAAGGGALNSLTSLLGVQPMTLPPDIALPNAQTASTQGQNSVQNFYAARHPNGGTLGSLAPSQTPAQQQTQSSYVTIQAPNNGPTKQVPANEVDHYVSRGAQVVNS